MTVFVFITCKGFSVWNLSAEKKVGRAKLKLLSSN